MNVERTIEFILDSQAKFAEDLRSLQAEVRNNQRKADIQFKGIRTLLLQGMKMMVQNEKRWAQNEERWAKNDVRWAKNEERWAKNEERWAKNEERFKRLLDALVRTNGGRR